MTDPTQYYTLEIAAATKELEGLRRRFTYIYGGRVILFAAIIASIVLLVGGESGVLYAISLALSTLLFALLIRLDMRSTERKRYLKRKIELCRREIDSIGGDSSAGKLGSEYRALNPHLVADFDLVGEGSLFQYLNRSATLLGERLFAKKLCSEELSVEDISARQEAVQELSQKSPFIQDFQIYGEIADESEQEIEWLKAWLTAPLSSNKMIIIYSFIAPIISLLWLVLYLCSIAPLETISTPLVINLVVSMLFTKAIDKEHAMLNKASKVVSKYAKLLSLIERENFSSKILSGARSRLTSNNRRASDSISKLSQLLDMFDSRYNLFVVLCLNPLFAYPLQLYRELASWRRLNRELSVGWLDSITEVDSLIGLATFAYNNSASTNYPEAVASGVLFEAEELGHPLIPQDRRVSNSITIGSTPSLVIITGANMAGKSTFLRAVAVNMILAMNGAPVAAKSLRFTPATILSSIKIQDSLHRSESYFYAEISRLKEITTAVSGGGRTMVILDEILRGTNTLDKQQGSLGLLRRLIHPEAIIFIATHDLVIGELESEYPEIAKNYCFEVELDGEELSFDYKIKRGVSQRLNASYLLRQMGLID